MVVPVEEEEDEETIEWVSYHYCSAHSILLVGDGDFSFSLSLATSFGSASNIVATSLDSYDNLVKKYSKAQSNLESLKEMEATILHGIDATKMRFHTDLKTRKFDRIVFNFPHAGFLGKEDDIYVINLHRKLVFGFFENACRMLRPGGEIHVSHKTSGPFEKWDIVDLASWYSLVNFERADFSVEDYPGYKNKRGEGKDCDKPFPLGECCIFKFKIGHSNFRYWGRVRPVKGPPAKYVTFVPPPQMHVAPPPYRVAGPSYVYPRPTHLPPLYHVPPPYCVAPPYHVAPPSDVFSRPPSHLPPRYHVPPPHHVAPPYRVPPHHLPPPQRVFHTRYCIEAPHRPAAGTAKYGDFEQMPAPNFLPRSLPSSVPQPNIVHGLIRKFGAHADEWPKRSVAEAQPNIVHGLIRKFGAHADEWPKKSVAEPTCCQEILKRYCDETERMEKMLNRSLVPLT